MENIKINRLVGENTIRAIFSLALPAMASMVMITLFNLVDIFWVGKLGAGALAGVSASTFIIWATYSILDITANGINALVAQNVGANELNTANKIGVLGIFIGLVLSIFITVSGLVYHNDIFIFMGLESDVKMYASDYFIWFLLGISASFTWLNIDAIFRGSGDTKTPMKLFALALVLNAVLDPIFIFGLWFFPRLEVKGAAIATVLSHLLSCIIGIIILVKRGWKFYSSVFSFNSEKNFEIIYKIIRIGLPIGITGFIFSLVYIFLTPIISQFGTTAVAAVGVGHRVESIAFFACVGFSIAAATLVGQNLGAGLPDKAEKSAWLTVLYISLVLIPVSLVFIFLPEKIIAVFISDENVISEGAKYLRIVGYFEIFVGFEIVLEQAFSGAGDTLPPMLISVPLTVARIPLAYFLANEMGFGSNGIWWAISLSTLIKGLLLAFWFKLGKWKNIKI